MLRHMLDHEEILADRLDTSKISVLKNVQIKYIYRNFASK